MKNKQLLKIAYIYIVICLIIWIIKLNFELKQNKEDFKLAKTVAVEFYEDNESLREAIQSLNKQLDEVIEFEKMIEDLKRVPRGLKSSVLANCFNESNLNESVIHKGKLDKTTVGMCGIKAFWIDIIDELNEDNINSLYGGYLVLSYLINETGSLESALMKYKGSIKNYKPVQHTLELKKLIKI